MGSLTCQLVSFHFAVQLTTVPLRPSGGNAEVPSLARWKPWSGWTGPGELVGHILGCTDPLATVCISDGRCSSLQRLLRWRLSAAIDWLLFSPACAFIVNPPINSVSSFNSPYGHDVCQRWHRSLINVCDRYIVCALESSSRRKILCF